MGSFYAAFASGEIRSHPVALAAENILLGRGSQAQITRYY